jgi:hypothetical protein
VWVSLRVSLNLIKINTRIVVLKWLLKQSINNKRAPALNSIIIFSCFMSILQSYGLEVASISFSAAFLTYSLYHFNTSPQLKLVHTNKFDESQVKLVERSISLVLASKPRQQLYWINIYHTTCKIEVNGRHMYQFLDELKVIGILQSYGLEVASISFSAAFLTYSL